MIWRERRVLLIILALLLIANAVFFFTYRVQYESRLRDLDARLEDGQRELKAAQTARLTAEQQLRAYAKVRSDVDAVYDQRWATQNERLTQLIAEVKKLAVASSLVPGSYSFSRSAADSMTASDRAKAAAPGAAIVGIGFSVQGTYPQARRLINLLELSPQFVIIDQISLTAQQGENLTLTLHLKTLFKDTSIVTNAGARS